MNADDHSRTLLIQLDLSAAFDTLDKDTLLLRLKTTFGIHGAAYSWICSYLQDRHQIVRVGSKTSTSDPCLFGVPQDSVLGPMLFTLYIASIARVVAEHSVSLAQYADDTQLYISLKSSSAVSVIDECFRSVHHWLDANGLCLNPGKSEAIIIGTGAMQRKAEHIDTITVADVNVPVSETVKSLGVTIDSSLSFDQHVNNMCKSAHFHIRALRHIRKCITTDDAKSVAAAMVSARLDYCNLMLHGTSKQNVNKLQRIQNMLARTVVQARKYDHVSPILVELHWLPIAARIHYKMALTTYKVLTTQQPHYLYDLLQLHRPARQLRSCQHNQLDLNRTRTVFAQRAFRNAAPSVWNSLPYYITDNLESLTVFKTALKTYLSSLYL